MPVIDTFLQLMLERRAERLLLVADRVPCLLRAGETVELSMPALRAEMLQRIAGEIGGEAATRDEGTFRAADGVEFGFIVRRGEPEWRIEVHALGTAPALPSQDPLARAVASSFASRPAAVDEPAPARPTAASPHPPAAENPSRELSGILHLALEREASDLFLSTGRPPRIRRQGRLQALDAPPPEREAILSLLPDAAAREALERDGSADFALRLQFPDGPRRLRANVFRHLDGIAAALRPIRRQPPTLAELSLPSDLARLATFPHGLVLVTGASGSGKSSTLAALVDYLNQQHSRHILTIEDPIEHEHLDIRSLIHQREVGTNVASFATGLRAALRENPDVILLGELRDLDTISAALTAAETGHLVLATLHSGSASSAINRIVDVFPGHQQAHVRTQLSVSLRAVISQRLLTSRAGKRIPVLERLLVTPAVANGIREGQDHFIRNAMITGVDEGMITLERSLANLVRERVIDRETAIRHAADPKALANLMD